MTRAEIDRKEQELRDRIDELHEEINDLADIVPEDGYAEPRGPSNDEISTALRAIFSDEAVKAQLNSQVDMFKWFKEHK